MSYFTVNNLLFKHQSCDSESEHRSELLKNIQSLQNIRGSSSSPTTLTSYYMPYNFNLNTSPASLEDKSMSGLNVITSI